MAAKLGGVFLTCALGPVNYAGACIQGSKMPQGIHELAPEALWGGLQRGMEETAKLAGVKARDVEGALPMGEIRACLDQIAASHGAALHAWGIYAGQVGGLLSGIAELTVDGRAPDASICLARVAKKVKRDRPFSEPLQALSDDIGRWQDLLGHCRRILDQGGALARAYQRRRLRNALAIGFSAGLLVAGTVVLVLVRAGRARVEAVLSSEDPCAVRALSETELDRGSGAQRARVAARLEACVDGEARRAREAEETRQREERAREEAAARAARDAKCAALAERLAAGQVAPEDEALAGAGAALLRRIGDKALTPPDLGPDQPKLPCLGSPGGDPIKAAFAEAAVKSVWVWAGFVDPSDATRDALAPRAVDIPPRAKVMVSLRAAEAAKRSLGSGDATEMDRAARLCALADVLGMPGGKTCDAVKDLSAKDR